MRDSGRGRGIRIERPTGENVDEAAAEHFVRVDRDRAGLDELHRRPALEPAVAEPIEHERAVSPHADGLDEGRHEATDVDGVLEAAPVAAVQVDRRKHPPRGVKPSAGAFLEDGGGSLMHASPR